MTSVAATAEPSGAPATTSAKEPADAGTDITPTLAASAHSIDESAEATPLTPDASARPPTDAGTSRGLSPEPIRAVVMGGLGSFQACYERVLAKQPELKGGIVVAFSIAPDGAVSSATVSSSSMGNPEVETCMAGEFGKLKFPAAEKPTHATFPFVFKGIR